MPNLQIKSLGIHKMIVAGPDKLLVHGQLDVMHLQMVDQESSGVMLTRLFGNVSQIPNARFQSLMKRYMQVQMDLASWVPD